MPRRIETDIEKAGTATVARMMVRVGALYAAVNKRSLSTGESRELVRENLGSGLNPGG